MSFSGYEVLAPSIANSANASKLIDSFDGYNFRLDPGGVGGIDQWSIPANVFSNYANYLDTLTTGLANVHALPNGLVATRGSSAFGAGPQNAVYLFNRSGALVNTIADSLATVVFNLTTTMCDNGSNLLFGITAFNQTQIWRCRTSDSALTVNVVADNKFGNDLCMGSTYVYAINAVTGAGTLARVINVNTLTYSEVDLSGLGHAIAGIGYDHTHNCAIVVTVNGTVYKYSDDLSSQLSASSAGLLGTLSPNQNSWKRMCSGGFLYIVTQTGAASTWNLYKVDLSTLTVSSTHNSADTVGGFAVSTSSDKAVGYTWAAWDDVSGGFFMVQHQGTYAFFAVPWGSGGGGTVTTDTLSEALIGATYRRTSAFATEAPTVIGWHRHDLGHARTLTSIGVSSEAGGLLDNLDMVTTDGTTYYVEGLTQIYDENDVLTDAWFVDGGLVPDSAYEATVSAVTGIRFTGLWYLQGQFVSVWALGLDLGDFTVDANGTVFVPYGSGTAPATFDYSVAGQGAYLFTAAYISANVSSTDVRNGGVPYGGGFMPCCVGLPFTSDGQALRPAIPETTGTRAGPSLGQRRRSHSVNALLHNTLGISFGSDFDLTLQSATMNDEAGTQPIPTEPFSGVWTETLNDDYSYDSMVSWRITRPYPASVVSIGTSVEGQDS